jgi:hypothetical protein
MNTEVDLLPTGWVRKPRTIVSPDGRIRIYHVRRADGSVVFTLHKDGLYRAQDVGWKELIARLAEFS